MTTRCVICSKHNPCAEHPLSDQDDAMQDSLRARRARHNLFAVFEPFPVDPREIRWAENERAMGNCMCHEPMIRCGGKGCYCNLCGLPERMNMFNMPLHKDTAHILRVFTHRILNGDDYHRKWLLEAVEAFIAGNAIPEPSSPSDWTLEEMREKFEAIREVADQMTKKKPEKGKRAPVRFG